MEESEKQKLRQAKIAVVEHLKNINLDNYDYALQDTDPRLLEYVTKCISNPELHNLFELLSIKRFFYLCDKYEWKRAKVLRFFTFYELLQFSGVNGRQSYKLTPVQCFQFANIFGFERENKRLVTDVILYVPRKYSKTTSTASLAVWELLFGDANSQTYCGANDFNQAKILFDEIRNIVKDFDPTLSSFKVNREKIWCLLEGRESTATCLTANAQTKDGLNCSLCIMDEYSQSQSAELKNVLVSSMGARLEPLVVTITTASDKLDSPFVQELESAKKVLLGEMEDDSIFAHLFQPDVDDEEGDPNTWKKVQPHLGITVQSDYYANYWKRAMKTAEDMLTFRTKLLNIFATDERKSWIDNDKAMSLLEDFDMRKAKHRPKCIVAFDLSVKDDFSAVTYTTYDSTLKKFFCFTEYYFPKGQLEKHPNSELYKIWVEQGYLKLCEGDCIDYKQIGNDIIGMTRYVNIIQIGYDSYKAQDLVNMLISSGAGKILKPFPQTYGSFNLPTESFEMMAYHDPPLISLNNNLINLYCLRNVVIDTDRLENKKPIKRSQNTKIDGVITALMTIGLAKSFRK